MNAVVTSGVADCVRSHTSWITALAQLSPHPSWTDGPLHWVWSADGRSLHGVFPEETPPAAVRRAVEAADALGAVRSVRARRHEAHLQPLLARDDTWRAEARSGPHYAGRAWLHVTDNVAGLCPCRLSDSTRVVTVRSAVPAPLLPPVPSATSPR